MVTITLRYYDSNNHFNYTGPTLSQPPGTFLFRHPRFSSAAERKRKTTGEREKKRKTERRGERLSSFLLSPFYTMFLFTTTRFKFGLRRTEGETVPGRFANEVKKLAKESRAKRTLTSRCKAHVAGRET